MCLILFGLDCHPDYRLVAAANRDEFYDRPALPAAFWDDRPELLAGRDLAQGGTWLGITRSGRFSALTNYRNPALNREDAPTRGRLVSDFLTGSPGPEEYIQTILARGDIYNSYNLLAGTGDGLFYHSNRATEPFARVEPGVHGLSNSLLDVPWRKVRRGKEKLSALLERKKVEPGALLDLLYDREVTPDDELPRTGVTLERERMLSPIFLVSPEFNYGTRVSTALLVGRDGHVEFAERTFSPGTGEASGEVYFDFDLKG